MSGFAVVTAAEIEEAKRQIDSARSLDEIQAAIERFSATATRQGGVLYSGNIDEETHSGKVARVIADETDVAIIDDTPRAQLLSNSEVEQSIRDAAKRIFVAEGRDAIQAERSANMFLYGAA